MRSRPTRRYHARSKDRSEVYTESQNFYPNAASLGSGRKISGLVVNPFDAPPSKALHREVAKLLLDELILRPVAQQLRSH